MYMSYCRFEGTKMELAACLGEVNEHLEEAAEYKVSDNEIRCFRRMVEDFVDFLHDACLLDECGDLDHEALDEVCDMMGRSYAEEDYA